MRIVHLVLGALFFGFFYGPSLPLSAQSQITTAAVDGTAVVDIDHLVRKIAARRPGTVSTLQLIRDGRPMTVPVKLAERPLASSSADAVETKERERPNQKASVVGM